MMSHEEKTEGKINSIFETFRKKIKLESDPLKRKALYENLKLEIYKLRQVKEDSFAKALAFILATSPIINNLGDEIESVISKEKHIKSVTSLIDSEILDKTLKQTVEESHQEVIQKSVKKLERIARTEAWREVNEARLKEFQDKGYKYKTTYPIKDDKTGDDSWYYYSLRQIKPINEPFEYIWKGVTRTFMAPPDRPNDRNVLIPYLGEVD
jgi:polyribonucleotide nucleotidyltransferase